MWWTLAAASAAPSCAWNSEIVAPGELSALASTGDGTPQVLLVDGGRLKLATRDAGTWRAEDLGPGVGGDLIHASAAAPSPRVARTACDPAGGCEVSVGERGSAGWSWRPVDAAEVQVTAPVFASPEHLLYAVRKDGSTFTLRHAWLGSPVRVDDVASATAARPATAIAPDGTVHVAFRPASVSDKVIRHAWLEPQATAAGGGPAQPTAWRTEVLNADAGIAGSLWFSGGVLHAVYGDLTGVKVARRTGEAWTEVALAPETAWTRAAGDLLATQGMRSRAVRAAVPDGDGWAQFELGSGGDSGSVAVAAVAAATCPLVAWSDREGRVVVASPR